MQDLPMGFGMALAQNTNAMQYFSNCPPEQQQQILNQTHQIQSKNEMAAFVQSLAGRT